MRRPRQSPLHGAHGQPWQSEDTELFTARTPRDQELEGMSLIRCIRRRWPGGSPARLAALLISPRSCPRLTGELSAALKLDA
jgi:hypothetical protein